MPGVGKPSRQCAPSSPGAGKGRRPRRTNPRSRTLCCDCEAQADSYGRQSTPMSTCAAYGEADRDCHKETAGPSIRTGVLGRDDKHKMGLTAVSGNGRLAANRVLLI